MICRTKLISMSFFFRWQSAMLQKLSLNELRNAYSRNELSKKLYLRKYYKTMNQPITAMLPRQQLKLDINVLPCKVQLTLYQDRTGTKILQIR